MIICSYSFFPLPKNDVLFLYIFHICISVPLLQVLASLTLIPTIGFLSQILEIQLCPWYGVIPSYTIYLLLDLIVFYLQRLSVSTLIEVI